MKNSLRQRLFQGTALSATLLALGLISNPASANTVLETTLDTDAAGVGITINGATSSAFQESLSIGPVNFTEQSAELSGESGSALLGAGGFNGSATQITENAGGLSGAVTTLSGNTAAQGLGNSFVTIDAGQSVETVGNDVFGSLGSVTTGAVVSADSVAGVAGITGSDFSVVQQAETPLGNGLQLTTGYTEAGAQGLGTAANASGDTFQFANYDFIGESLQVQGASLSSQATVLGTGVASSSSQASQLSVD